MKVTQKQLAEFFGVTPRTIRRWEGKGMPRTDEGTYRTDECVKWRVKTAEAELEAELEDIPPRAESRAKREYLRARREALDLAEREEELLPVDVFREVLGEVLDVLRARLLNFPGRWATQLVGLDSAREAEGVLREAIRELLEELSTEAADELEGTFTGGETPDPAA